MCILWLRSSDIGTWVLLSLGQDLFRLWYASRREVMRDVWTSPPVVLVSVDIQRLVVHQVRVLVVIMRIYWDRTSLGW